jgi:hypothetical protein
MTIEETMHSNYTFFYVVDILGLEEMNDLCWKTVHIGTMDRSSIVTQIRCAFLLFLPKNVTSI